MIVCHRYGFIFLKTQKTAGTSLELALSRYCGPGAIVTSVTPEDELKRSEIGGVGPQNDVVPVARRRIRDHARSWRDRVPTRFYNHVPARVARTWIGRKTWNDYYKFAVERNPWDKALSFYWWRTRNADKRPDVTMFILRARHTDLSNFHIYSLRGHVAVDHILRYEDLSTEIAALARRLDLPEVPELPRAKSGYRKDRRPYQEVLTAKAREHIGEVCRREIDLLGYRFEGESTHG